MSAYAAWKSRKKSSAELLSLAFGFLVPLSWLGGGGGSGSPAATAISGAIRTADNSKAAASESVGFMAASPGSTFSSLRHRPALWRDALVSSRESDLR